MVTLYYGDCLEVLPTLEKSSCDMAFNDLPYGTSRCSWDTIIPFDKMWGALHAVMKEKAAKIFTGTEPFSSYLRIGNIEEFKYDWIWDTVNKVTNHLNAKIQPMRKHEILSVFYKDQSIFNGQKREGSYTSRKTKVIQSDVFSKVTKTDSGRKVKGLNPVSIVSIKGHFTNTKMHGTQKPVELISYMIKTYTNEGGTIVDITAGSGSTGIAAQDTNRDCILIEKNPLWYNVAVRRNQGEDVKSLKAYIKEMRELYGEKKADFLTPLQFDKIMRIGE